MITTWSPCGEAFQFGHGFAKVLLTRQMYIDKQAAAASRARGRSKQRKNHALAKLRYGLDNRRRDAHYKIANCLVHRYAEVHIPDFRVQGMIAKGSVLHPTTKREMLVLGHYAFRQRLKEMGQKVGRAVGECTEEYTSKTCYKCSKVKENLV